MSKQLEFEFVQEIPIITICYPISLPAAAGFTRFRHLNVPSTVVGLLRQLGLQEWLCRLQELICALRRYGQLSLSSYNQMEDLLNESNIIALRAFLSTTDPRGREESEGQDDDAG